MWSQLNLQFSLILLWTLTSFAMQKKVRVYQIKAGALVSNGCPQFWVLEILKQGYHFVWEIGSWFVPAITPAQFSLVIIAPCKNCSTCFAHLFHPPWRMQCEFYFAVTKFWSSHGRMPLGDFFGWCWSLYFGRIMSLVYVVQLFQKFHGLWIIDICIWTFLSLNKFYFVNLRCQDCFCEIKFYLWSVTIFWCNDFTGNHMRAV